MDHTLILYPGRLMTLLSFFLVNFIQAYYYIYFFSRLALFKKKEKTTSQTHPVSVIICARDESANLSSNLPASLTQEYNSAHEVILVDDNSFDDTKYKIQEFQKTFKHLKLVELKQEAKFIPGKKFPLSVGIKTAKYEIVLLTDADCIPVSKQWIELMQEGFGPETEIVLGYGGYHKTPGLLNKMIRWETFQTALQYLSFSLAGKPYMGVGRNLCYKKSVFFRHKGFSSHNHLASGDDDLFINLAGNSNNTEIVIDRKSFTLSTPADSWSRWVRQKKRHYTTSRYYKITDKLRLGFYSVSHFFYYPLLALAIFSGEWKLSLVMYSFRLVMQGYVFYKTMKKLDESDLFPWFIFLDIWMFFYYLMFSLLMLRKPSKKWN